MGLIVVDASVAIKWVLNEADSALADALLHGSELLAAPELVRVEGCSAIARAFRTGRVPPTDVTHTIEMWLAGIEAGTVELAPDRLHLRRAVEIACEISHPLPDCLYLALAEHIDARLVTADTTFARRAAAISTRVRLLGSDA